MSGVSSVIRLIFFVAILCYVSFPVGCYRFHSHRHAIVKGTRPLPYKSSMYSSCEINKCSTSISIPSQSFFRCYGHFHAPSLRQQEQSARKADKEKNVLNDEITFEKVRVIIPSNDDAPEESLGIVTRKQALDIAKQRNMDLLLINDKANPPVCKIVDFGRFKYNQARKKRDQQKSSNKSKAGLKEIKLSYKIDTHDVEVKQKAILGFLQEGDRVSLVVHASCYLLMNTLRFY